MKLRKYITIGPKYNIKPKKQILVNLYLNNQINNDSFKKEFINNRKHYYSRNISNINLGFNTSHGSQINLENIINNTLTNPNQINYLYKTRNNNFLRTYKNKNIINSKFVQDIDNNKYINNNSHTINYIPNKSDIICMHLKQNIQNLKQKIDNFNKIIEKDKSKYTIEKNIILNRSNNLTYYENNAKIINNDFSIFSNINSSKNNNLYKTFENYNNDKIQPSRNKIRWRNLLLKNNNQKQDKPNYTFNNEKNDAFHSLFKNEEIDNLDTDDLSDVARALINYNINNNLNSTIKETTNQKNNYYKKKFLKKNL